MKKLFALVMTLALPTVGNGAELSLSDPGPTWATPSLTPYDLDRTVINSFPPTSEFGSGTVSVVQGPVGAIQIPSNSNVYQANSVAGYSLNLSPVTSGVGVFGQYAIGADGAKGDGVNAVCSNGPLQTSTIGFNIGSMACNESDLNISLTSAGVAPTGSAFGFYAAGSSNTQPAGEFPAYYVQTASVTGAIKWKNGFKTADKSTLNALTVGAQDAGASSASQTIIYRSFDSSNNLITGYTAMDGGGNFITQLGRSGTSLLVLDGGSGSVVAQFGANASFTSGHALVSGNAPTLSGCGTSPAIRGTDEAGTITVGSSITTCMATFAAAYGTRPFCTLTSENGHTVLYGGTTAAALILTGLTASDVIDYHCKSMS